MPRKREVQGGMGWKLCHASKEEQIASRSPGWVCWEFIQSRRVAMEACQIVPAEGKGQRQTWLESSGAPQQGQFGLGHFFQRAIIFPTLQKPDTCLDTQCLRVRGIAFMARSVESQSILLVGQFRNRWWVVHFLRAAG